MVPESGDQLSILGLSFLSLACFAMIVSPRRYAVLPVIVAALYITLGQLVNVAGLHFSVLRIVIISGWLRVIFRREIDSIRMTEIDKCVLLWVIANCVIYCIQWQTWAAFVNRLGFAYNALGIYFLFRILITSLDDIHLVVRLTAIAVGPLALLMLVERITGHNLFALLGGVPEMTELRDGKLRCQGPFAHPILAGTTGAAFVPLFLMIYTKEKARRIVPIIGWIAATTITLVSVSSGPVMTFLSGIAGLLAWPLRKSMKAVMVGAVLMLVLLQLVMKAPVWFLIGKASNIVGGHGWYRSELIQQAINHINEWFLLGTSYTAHWMPFNVLPADPRSADITNWYVKQGVEGGIITLILFLLVIILCFRVIARTISVTDSRSTSITAWALGATLFAHATSFFSVSYFDQIVVFWYLPLAMISVLQHECESAWYDEPCLDVVEAEAVGECDEDLHSGAGYDDRIRRN